MSENSSASAVSQTTDRETLAVEEFRELRATIRERGTARLFVAVITFVAWSGLLLWAGSSSLTPFFSLVSLTTLAVGFESLYSAHVGAERIGRYLQIRHETASVTPLWEQSVMELGLTPSAATSADPLYTWLFLAATALNFVPLVVRDAAVDADFSLAIIHALAAANVVAHIAFAVRLFRRRMFVRRQRQVDLELFRELAARPRGQTR